MTGLTLEKAVELVNAKALRRGGGAAVCSASIPTAVRSRCARGVSAPMWRGKGQRHLAQFDDARRHRRWNRRSG